MRTPVKVAEPTKPKRTPVRLTQESVYWFYASENASPLVTPEFLAIQQRLLLPGQFAREHQNAWVDAADSLFSAADVDFAMSQGWTEPAYGDSQLAAAFVYFIDLGAINDPSVIACGHLNAVDHAVIDKLITFQGSREQPVQLAHVEATLLDCCRAFPPCLIRIESWQGLGSVQRLLALGLPVELYTPTIKTATEEWPILVHRFTDRTILLPRHARLREELLNLQYEVTAIGIRVTDKGKIHQDHAVAVRGVVAALQPFVLGEQVDLSHLEQLSPEEEAFHRQVAVFWGTPGIETHPDYVPADDVSGYEGRDMHWSRVAADGARRPLW
jgi:hypothetical protein